MSGINGSGWWKRGDHRVDMRCFMCPTIFSFYIENEKMRGKPTKVVQCPNEKCRQKYLYNIAKNGMLPIA